MLTLLGMGLLGLGSYLYVVAERTTAGEPETRKKRSKSEELMLNEDDF